MSYYFICHVLKHILVDTDISGQLTVWWTDIWLHSTLFIILILLMSSNYLIISLLYKESKWGYDICVIYCNVNSKCIEWDLSFCSLYYIVFLFPHLRCCHYSSSECVLYNIIACKCDTLNVNSKCIQCNFCHFVYSIYWNLCCCHYSSSEYVLCNIIAGMCDIL